MNPNQRFSDLCPLISSSPQVAADHFPSGAHNQSMNNIQTHVLFLFPVP